VLRDGPRVLFSQPTGLMTLTLDRERSVVPLLSGQGNAVGGADAAVSPDGRWLAYASVVSGSPQVYVSQLSDPAGPRTHVTPSGGSQPRWAGHGRELFYTALDGSVMGVSVTPGQTFMPGTPVRVLDTRYYNARGTLSRGGTYDVTRDGQRFVMLKSTGDPAQSTEAPTIVVVKNWGEELERLLPARRR
jgi:Tol biopolymer transport system component